LVLVLGYILYKHSQTPFCLIDNWVEKQYYAGQDKSFHPTQCFALDSKKGIVKLLPQAIQLKAWIFIPPFCDHHITLAVPPKNGVTTKC
jgi:hypothetical protein